VGRATGSVDLRTSRDLPVAVMASCSALSSRNSRQRSGVLFQSMRSRRSPLPIGERA
jgi:hypothetical protein